MRSHRSPLPVAPLLRAYTDGGVPDAEVLGRLPVLGPRFRAVLAAPDGLLNGEFLDTAPDAVFRAALTDFYRQCVHPPLQLAALQRRAGLVRHGLAHLLRSPGPLPQKAERVLAPGGAYHVPGIGPAFWSALFQALDPVRHPAWLPATVAGLRRLGLARWPAEARPGAVYAV